MPHNTTSSHRTPACCAKPTNTKSEPDESQKLETKRAPTGKRVREPEDTPAEPQPKPAKKARVNTKKPDTQSSPRRSGRTTKPTAAVVQKRKRRTKAEIEADKAAAAEAKRRFEEEIKERDQHMAEMDCEEENDKAQTAEKTIRRLSDMTLNNDLDGEEFVGFDEVSSTSDDDSENITDWKANYEALRKEMDVLQQKLGGGKKKGTNGGKKKSTKEKDITYASGLLSDWKKANCATKDLKKPFRHIEVVARGLDDDDADAVSPFIIEKQDSPRKVVDSGKRDLSRQNELVAIISKDDIEPINRTVCLPKPTSKKVVAATTNTIPTSIKVKSENKENLYVYCKKAGIDKKGHVINSNNARITNLPDFAQNRTWRKVFLPTLYDKFFTSCNPFSQFLKGSAAFLSLLQTTIEEVYPNVQYTVTASSVIHALAYNRINEKRSSIGSTAITIINQHIKTLNGAKAIQDWIVWASRPDGPLFFREPVTQDAPLNNRDPRYVRPGGKLLSKFIINVAKPFLHLKVGSVSSNRSGRPQGLIALVMAALERAVKNLIQSPDKTKDFSNGYWGSKVMTYYASLQSIEEARWDELLETCGILTTEGRDDTCQANLSFLDNNRAHLFDFASPKKA